MDHLDHLDLTTACFYLSLTLTWFIMGGELLVMQPHGSGITLQSKYERLILNQNSKANSKLICLNLIIIVRQSLSTTTDSLLFPYSAIWHIVDTDTL